MESFDYLVIGAGHNGLTAGATLAEQGRSVCVLERLDIAGGLSPSHPHLPHAPDHLLSLGAMDDMFMAQTPLARQMRLAEHGYATIPLSHPYGWVDPDGETLLLWHDVSRAVEEIRHFSPADARTYDELQGPINWIMDLVDVLFVRHPSAWRPRDLGRHLLRHRPDRATRRLIGALLTHTAFEWISETFESDAMRGLWAYWSNMIGPADAFGSGAYVLGFAGVHRGPGVLRPRGGMSGLVAALRSVLESHGGQVRLSAPVAGILVEEGRAAGVRLESGEVIGAHCAVLSNLAPQITFGRLTAPEALTRAEHNRLAMVSSNSSGPAAFKIDIASAGRLTFPAAEARRARRDDTDVRRTTLMTGTLEDHIALTNAARVGLTVDAPPVYMAILSATDPSIAPEGGDVLYLHSPVPLRPDGGWQEAEHRYSDGIWHSALRFLGGEEHEIGRAVTSPADFEDRFAAPAGAYFHVDMLIDRLGALRPARGFGGYDTPVTGLYLAGAAAHPSGGVTGWPGRLAARHAIRQEKTREPNPDGDA
ncbi:Beta-carotene ketolase [Pseudonocardia sp. Ae168_Ps1]|uniref:phytoene desaturase family protein n=1 Tax=unclassified Pseudonocardia TaxID=2619320 RepID=UPI00094AC874|nr:MULTISPECIES: NAD(P)/FAD-dependent oxidoreductase [unclassified Pseudonocardia]OLL73450.1 Beta-carotene ketolase [Pseudonocardia sp. Ae150A_Ps1]OLL79427.1 Beta-carotene ketolase [Pseudonocardia sp. Ae168_Ps1]OLL86439.1 Beta-carotene ketolase [Pseudonocardia sp. Ae263_Ps1]OLL93520.1 Beta-carotene ketolase [Pseudonocardia sp. Ae356_Ps1]